MESHKVPNRANGGLARAKSLTPERRKEIARNAALAKYKKPLKALYKGNFRDDFGFDVDCYVLNDDKRSAVISQRGMGIALGLSGSGGAAFTRFANGKTIRKYLGPDLLQKIEQPIVFQSNVDGPGLDVYGYDVTILIDVCQAIILAENDGALQSNQRNLAMAAKVITGACAKSGIQELVYKIVGMDSTKEQFIVAFKRFVQEEVRRYESEFPIELYEEWTRLYHIDIPVRGWPWKFRTLTIDHVYVPLAKSNGRILKLLREQKLDNGDRNKKLFQFLSDIGTKALRFQLGRVLEMAQSSATLAEYENKISERFGGQTSFEFEK